MATRLRRELEPKWVSWYCARHYPKAIVRLRCPLGPIPEELKKLHGERKAIKVYRPWRPEVDACITQPGVNTLIEAKIFKYMDGLSKLPVYKNLVPVTPELKPWKDLPITMILLLPHEISWVKAAAARMDVGVVVEAPDHIIEAWEDRDKYWTKSALKKRDERKKKLREMGFE